MLRRILILVLLAVAGCGAPGVASPSPVRPPTTLALPSLAPVGATVLVSDIGKTPVFSGAATPVASENETETPAVPITPATSEPVVTPNAVGFDFALRPEFKGDLNAQINKTVYTMRWDLNDDLSVLNGTQRVIFVNRTGQSLSEVYFRLFANYPGEDGGIQVTSVQISGRGAVTELQAQNTVLKVSLGRPLPPERMIILQLQYQVRIPSTATTRYAEFINDSWVTTLPTVYPIIPAFDAAGWHLEVPPAYGDLVFADSSVYDVTITTPEQYKVIASGQMVQETESAGRISRRFIGAPMRDFDANITNTLVSASAQVGDVTINSWYLPAHTESGQRALDWTVESLKIFEKRFGAYPFKELDVVETPTTAGGIEYPGLITVATALYADPGQLPFFEFATVHETAHQWFYSTIGDDQVNHPWLDESLAQYATLVYFQDRYGQETANNIQTNYFDKQYETAKAKYGDRPAGLPVSAYDEDAYGAFVYAKGPKFFQAVRAQIGDDAFFKALQTYYQDFKYRIAYPPDLINAFNAASGQDISPLYKQWITG